MGAHNKKMSISTKKTSTKGVALISLMGAPCRGAL
jgi:hypothetical protein